MNELRYAFRQLLKNPGFTAVAVLTLALGIGVNTAIFNVGNALLLRPLPFKEPDQLFALTWINQTNGNTSRQRFIYPIYEEYRDQCRDVLQLMAYSGFSEMMTDRGQPERVTGQLVSVNFFSNLGIEPVLGRGFLAEDEQSQAETPIVISDGFWKRRFAADPNVLGTSFSLGRSNALVSYTVIGVAPPGLKSFPDGHWNVDVWTPIRVVPGKKFKGEFPIACRLTRGIRRPEALAAVDRVTRHIEESYGGNSVPGYEEHGLLGLENRAELVPAGRGSWGPYRPTNTIWKLFALFMGAVGLVLLIACANLANLLLVRAVKRRKEIAIRLALGATRLALVRQLMIESVILALMAGTGGLLVSLWCSNLLVKIKPIDWLEIDLAPDIRMLCFALILSLVTAVAFGLAPALQALRFNLHPTLKDDTATAPWASRRFSLRNLLVIVQVAVSLVLLAGAGLCLRDFRNLQAIDAGFAAKNVLIVPLHLRDHDYSSASASSFYTELIERVSVLPGVRQASFADSLPLAGTSSAVGSPDLIEGYVGRPGESVTLQFSEIGPGYFQTIGQPLGQGREFTPRDRKGAPRVAVVNESLARRYWPGQDPVGKRVRYAGGLEVVGVAKDSRFVRLWTTPQPFLYLPALQLGPSDQNLMVKTEANPWLTLAAVKSEIQKLDKRLEISGVQTLEQIRAASLAGERFSMILLSLLAGLALLIATMGLYGMIAYVTSQRIREIGVRMALGAQRGDILALVVSQGMFLVLAGLALGVAGASALTRFLSSILHGISPTDLPTFIGVAVLLALVALIACYLPGRRATKIDPMEALRYE